MIQSKIPITNNLFVIYLLASSILCILMSYFYQSDNDIKLYNQNKYIFGCELSPLAFIILRTGGTITLGIILILKMMAEEKYYNDLENNDLENIYCEKRDPFEQLRYHYTFCKKLFPKNNYRNKKNVITPKSNPELYKDCKTRIDTDYKNDHRLFYMCEPSNRIIVICFSKLFNIDGNWYVGYSAVIWKPSTGEETDKSFNTWTKKTHLKTAIERFSTDPVILLVDKELVLNAMKKNGISSHISPDIHGRIPIRSDVISSYIRKNGIIFGCVASKIDEKPIV